MNSTETSNTQTAVNNTLVYDIRHNRYINLTSRCTLRCQFCPKHNGSKQVGQYDLTLSKTIKAADIIPLLGDVSQFNEYVFCGYGEPTLNLDTLIEVAKTLKSRGASIRLNTDGLGNLFHRRNILPELAPYIDAMSISLNADNAAAYELHCRPKLTNTYTAVREFITLAPQFISQVSVSAINGLEGVDIAKCQQIALDAGCQFTQRELDVVG
ncbi:TatD family nuclease-associated radical SAM protein [Shewanella gaetbuli]|uniref:TatD family nuclease-associated radical SAM protein n=1 Tax=Shewanella gaetbuli TaxID=220752 RepID=A0A9X1ZK09_9GAMM|nr:TatD family nuclease-associated radical SAM protein [Shewanella gaetbuli]MCL1141277.1 TatD family nuclease-associated radical SAM protein [Shewanella gaetbuli]